MGRLQDRVALVTGAASGIGAACFLASDDASFVTGHAALVVDGGWTAGRRVPTPDADVGGW